FAIVRFESDISAIFASRALAFSCLVATAFRSLSSSFVAVRSSSVSTAPFLLVAVMLLADFCAAFVGLMEASPQWSLIVVEAKSSLPEQTSLRAPATPRMADRCLARYNRPSRRSRRGLRRNRHIHPTAASPQA